MSTLGPGRGDSTSGCDSDSASTGSSSVVEVSCIPPPVLRDAPHAEQDCPYHVRSRSFVPCVRCCCFACDGLPVGKCVDREAHQRRPGDRLMQAGVARDGVDDAVPLSMLRLAEEAGPVVKTERGQTNNAQRGAVGEREEFSGVEGHPERAKTEHISARLAALENRLGALEGRVEICESRLSCGGRMRLEGKQPALGHIAEHISMESGLNALDTRLTILEEEN